MPAHTATPLSRIQAAQIVANPGAYADRPTLIQLARMIAASAAGFTITQHRRAARSRPTKVPHLRVIQGGRAAEGGA